MSDTARIPLPRPTELSRPHWDGCREGVLLFQRCRDCGTAVFIPQPVCTGCFGDALEWVPSSGRGNVYSYTVVHRPQRPAFAVPYTVVIVELEEGWFMLSNLVDCDPAEVRIGLPVEVSFREMSEEITLPYFRPRGDRTRKRSSALSEQGREAAAQRGEAERSVGPREGGQPSKDRTGSGSGAERTR